MRERVARDPCINKPAGVDSHEDMEGTTPQGQTEQVELHLLPAAISSATSLARVSTKNTGGEEATEKWTLPDYVAKALSDDGDGQRPGRIAPVQNVRLLMIVGPSQTPSFIHLGLLSDRGESRQVKLSHLHSLVRRGHADGRDAAEFTLCMLSRFKERLPEIRLQHSPGVIQQWWNSRDLLVEELLIDAAFILEQLLRNWEAGTRPSMVMRPTMYRRDLIVFSNQIPYVLLQDLMQMVKLPPLPDNYSGSRRELLMRIAIGYIVAEEASEWLLHKCGDPVHHLLHLVQLHLASAVEQRLPPPPPSLWARCKVLGRHAFWEATRSAKQALRRAPDAAEPRLLGTAWWSYSMIPPAWDLDRVGIRLRPKMGTRCLADVCFRDGVLELPPLDSKHWIDLDGHLLINLVALEQEWESSRQLFTSYAVFMSELISSDRDVSLLKSEGVAVLQNSWEKFAGDPAWNFFRFLAEVNNGRELHGYFVQLAREINSYYNHLNCARSSCFTG